MAELKLRPGPYGGGIPIVQMWKLSLREFEQMPTVAQLVESRDQNFHEPRNSPQAPGNPAPTHTHP